MFDHCFNEEKGVNPDDFVVQAEGNCKNPNKGWGYSPKLDLLSWNGQGLTKTCAKTALCYLVRRNGHDFVLIMETKLSTQGYQNL